MHIIINQDGNRHTQFETLNQPVVGKTIYKTRRKGSFDVFKYFKVIKSGPPPLGLSGVFGLEVELEEIAISNDCEAILLENYN